MQIFLLGPPAIVWTGEALNIPRRHVRALLYHLAAADSPVPRARLCLLFWPDIPEANARRNLTRALTHLRRALPLPGALVADDETVHLDSRSCWSDAAEFGQLLDDSGSLDAVEQAIALYRGPFLDGFYVPDCAEFESWASEKRMALENAFLGAVSRLIDAAAGRKDYRRAIAYAHRYLEIDDLAETVHGRLISLYALSGDPSRALRQYEACASVLERELGVKPLPETRAIFESVLAGRLRDLPVEPAVTISSAPSRLLPVETPLAGRTAALQQLEDAMRQAAGGQSRVVLISGEPGIGKSRLLTDFAERCRPQGRVLLGAGQPAESSIPYHPIAETLRSGPVPAPAALAPIWYAEVARVLPELCSVYPDLPPAVALQGDEARIRLFEALSRYVFALQADSKPTLLCLDDLHWFDSTSLSWLVYLCRQLRTQNARMLVVATYRTEDADRVRELRDNLFRLGLLDELALEGLQVQSILELIRASFRSLPADESFARHLRDATGGNPFFVLETLRALEDRAGSGGALADPAELPLPASVRDAVDRRLSRLDPCCRQLLEAGAVVGHTFGFATVYLTAGREEIESSSALDALVKRQLLAEGADQYRFSHDLVRRATLAAVGPMRLRLLHARAARALEKLEPASVSALAEHFDMAGEWEQALQYHDLSAQQAERLFAWREAEAHLKRSLEILQLVDPAVSQSESLQRRAHVLSRLTRLHYLQGKLDERDDDLRHLHELARLAADPRLELEAILLEVQHLGFDARYEEAIARGEYGLALADRLGDRSARSRLLTQTGRSYTVLGQPARALSALQDAGLEVDRSGDKAQRRLVLSIMTQVYRALGDYRHALACAEEACAIDRELGDPYGAARHVETGFLYLNLGRFEDASRFLSECLTTARKAGIPSDEAHALLAIGGLCLYQGDPVSAIHNYQAALKIFEGLRRKELSASALAAIGYAHYRLGDLEQGRSWLTRGLDVARSIGHRMRVAQALFQLSLLDVSAGQLAAAESEAREGLSIARDIHAVDEISVGLAITARIERHSAAPDKAKGHAQEALSYAQRHDLAALQVLSRVEVALAQVDLSLLPAAREHTRLALLLMPTTHQLWIGAEQVHLVHARVLRGLGELVAAGEHEAIASSILKDKAGRIPDPAQRASFLALARQPL